MKFFLGALFILMLATACTQATVMLDSIPNPNTCAVPDKVEQEVNEPDWTWDEIGEIEIGVSTSEDLITKFGKPDFIRPWQTNNQKVACRYEYSEGKPVFWSFDGKIVGIEFSGYGLQSQTNPFALPINVSEAEAIHGRPELVGWSSYGSGRRTVVWLSKGILAVVFLTRHVDDSLISSIVFISPMSESEFQNSIWQSHIPSTKPTSDAVDAWPLNPFQ